ncbi:MAG: hypothetical protein JNL73_12955 [Anaerolineales bacterium]|nr:hypothetical protein [Anaerolineales bacterium]
MGKFIEAGSTLFAIAIQVSIQLVFVAMAIVWVYGRSDYDTFRRWGAAFCVAALSLIVIDGVGGVGPLLIQLWPSVAPLEAIEDGQLRNIISGRIAPGD